MVPHKEGYQTVESDVQQFSNNPAYNQIFKL